MAPLVPEVISEQFNFIIALIVGFGFGFALEQAGFSSTRKLVGLFYGYDFTVLRVFFTAGVTAMIGVLLLSHFGLLDTSIIYINPTFLWSAIIGGLIMGAGFIIGGFCPGTSFCAAAIGKIDAMFFIAGSFLGVFLFTEFYPFLEGIYLSQNMGDIRINTFFGLSRNAFAFIMTAIAVGAFIFTGKVQQWVTGARAINRPLKIKLSILSAIPFIIMAFITLTPSKRELILNRIAEAKRQKTCVFKEMSADKVAYELMHNYYKINLIDVRSPGDYKTKHLPLAINIPLDSMFNRDYTEILNQHHKLNIFYADKDTTAKKACLLAKFIGTSTNYILKENISEFQQMIFQAQQPAAPASKQSMNEYKFRTQAANVLINLDNTLGGRNRPVKNKAKRVKGGCA